jgi:cysteine-S-conjugate beta-lyase
MNDGSGDGRSPPPPRRLATGVVTAGRDPASYHGFVNPPVYHASTVLYPNAEDFSAHRARYRYGRRGTPTTEALELALQELEGPNCAGVSLLPSGLAANS